MDLFSFLDPSANNDQEMEDLPVEALERPSNKRKATAEPTELVPQITDVEDPGPSTKRPRIAAPAPVLLDEFETEAKREVDVSAGLTDNVEIGSKLELRHQVCSHSLFAASWTHHS